MIEAHTPWIALAALLVVGAAASAHGPDCLDLDCAVEYIERTADPGGEEPSESDNNTASPGDNGTDEESDGTDGASSDDQGDPDGGNGTQSDNATASEENETASDTDPANEAPEAEPPVDQDGSVWNSTVRDVDDEVRNGTQGFQPSETPQRCRAVDVYYWRRPGVGINPLLNIIVIDPDYCIQTLINDLLDVETVITP